MPETMYVDRLISPMTVPGSSFLKVWVEDLKISEMSGGYTIEGVLVASQFENLLAYMWTRH